MTDCFLPTDIGTKQSSPSEMQTEAKTQQQRLEKPVRIIEQVWPAGTVPLVSVFNWAYNHVDFIRESIESILMQETTFPVEIIIHDDASTDGTTDIIRQYEAKHPQLFRNIIQTENQWSQGKSVMDPMFTAPRGEFIALSHGDDYWLSTTKLEQQAMTMVSDPTVALVFHNCWVSHPESHRDFFLNHSLTTNRFSLADVIERDWFMATSSLVFRRFEPLPREIVNYSMGGDMLLQFGACLNGDAVNIDKVWSVYRRHEKGVSDAYWKMGDFHYETLRPNHIWMYWLFGEIVLPPACGHAIERRIGNIVEKILSYAVVHKRMSRNYEALENYLWKVVCDNKPEFLDDDVVMKDAPLRSLLNSQLKTFWKQHRRRQLRNAFMRVVDGVVPRA